MKRQDVTVKVITKARRTGVTQNADGSLTVKLNTAPEKGKANKELLDLLAEWFNVAKSDLEIVRGLTSRNKLVRIQRP
ncbi:MAG: hypothetical protein A3J59_00715 [Candidatus Buchananbacteria bacterium RIFCSPHIGHO2_02_FULL_56_16]|uniref:UPF0235 protein A3J59_00715 n=1 Tax=Candidatus Buchananbacteria bacterium RIFCSPHIGHO2_02_FULL_56_16 TaxID=1797542 RepID=A0A1G1YJA1_9BACT|nr:MAG: hypothetical protein A3J59_00715 [Candidatus Buchananbacteria bacterium RIFCSPHIGHO2_02_FULL_56_16]